MGYYKGGDNCYGRGDYYRGDYYRGDIFAGLKKIAKGVISVLPGPAGAVARALTGTGRGSVSVGPAAGPGGIPTVGYLPPPIGALPFGPELNPPGTALVPSGPGMACPQVWDPAHGRYRVARANKSTYVTRGGGTSRWPQQIIVHPKGTECVKSRRMNVANPRALRRAIRRATGFAKLSRRVLSFVQAKAPKGKPHFKRKK